MPNVPYNTTVRIRPRSTCTVHCTSNFIGTRANVSISNRRILWLLYGLVELFPPPSLKKRTWRKAHFYLGFGPRRQWPCHLSQIWRNPAGEIRIESSRLSNRSGMLTSVPSVSLSHLWEVCETEESVGVQRGATLPPPFSVTSSSSLIAVASS